MKFRVKILVLRFENLYFFLEILDQCISLFDSHADQRKFLLNSRVITPCGAFSQLGNHADSCK